MTTAAPTTARPEAVAKLAAAIRTNAKKGPGAALASANADVSRYRTRRALLALGLWVAIVLSACASFALPTESYFFLLSAEIFGGLTTFGLFLVLSLAGERTISLVLVFGVALAAAIGAYFLEEALRHLLLALSVGMLLAVALDHGVKALFAMMSENIAKRIEDASDEFALAIAPKLATPAPKTAPSAATPTAVSPAAASPGSLTLP